MLHLPLIQFIHVSYARAEAFLSGTEAFAWYKPVRIRLYHWVYLKYTQNNTVRYCFKYFR